MKKIRLPISILILSAALLAFSQSFGSKNPIIFAGDKNFPPIEYLEDGVPKGLNVDLLHELSNASNRKIEIRLMPWEEAQQKVLEGEIDAITTMAVTEKRKELFDFSEVTLRYQYCLFTTTEQVGIESTGDLEGKTVGVTKGGLPQQALESNPKIKLVVIRDYAEGFRLLLSQEIDAVGADRWVGAYTLQRNGIRGIAIRGEPFAEKISGIAVKKGNKELLNDINLGLSKLEKEGTLRRILAKWEPKEILFLTKGQVYESILYAGVVLLIAVIGAAFLWISSLKKQARVREGLLAERTAAEELARQRLAEIEDLYHNAPVGLCVLDTELRWVRINERLAEINGIPAADHIGKRVRDLMPELADTAEPEMRRVLETGWQRLNIEIVSETPAQPGVKRSWLEQWLPLTDAEGRVTGLSIVVEETTELRQVEMALRQSEERLRLLGDNLPESAIYQYVHETNGGVCFLHFSAGIERLNGVSVEDVLRDAGTLHRQIPPEYLERLQEAEAESAREMTDFDMEVPMRRPDGDIRWMRLHSRPRLMPDGSTIWDGVQIDVTERKRMEEELRKSRDELELRVQERTADLEAVMNKLHESNQALQDFVSIAAHDLQEPLRKVKTFGGMLEQKCSALLGEQERGYLERMLDANQRMQSLLTALLEYSRLSTRAEPFTEVELEKIVCDVLSDLEVRIESTGGEVQVGDLPVVVADPVQMRQLFQNLISNALKFHKSDERPIVRVSCTSADTKDCQIIIEDNGIGFDPEFAEQIFAPFQRLHGKGSQYEGTGIGLAICKKIVERHGGQISARSSPGLGSSFIVELPNKQL